MIFALTFRMKLHEELFHQLSFGSLAVYLVGDERPSLAEAKQVSELLAALSQELARYARCLRHEKRGLIPRGSRLGRLEFAPLVQLAKQAGHPAFRGLGMPALPETKEELFQHFDALLGCPGYKGSIAQFRTLFGFEVKDYVDFLVAQRRLDPALFLMLMAHEFGIAKAYVGEDPVRRAWIENGAKLAELCRLIDIVRYLDGNHLNVDQVRAGIKALCRPNGPTKKELAHADRAKPWIEQASYGVEALRAAFLGDKAGGLIAPTVSLSSWTPAMQARAVARCAWFAERDSVPATLFHFSRKRFARGRRATAYSYYGIDLEMLLMVGMRDLSRACGQAGGANSVRDSAKEIAGELRQSGDFPAGLGSERDSWTVGMYERIYLNAAGIAGSAGQFDHRHWFGSPDDEPLHEWLFDLVAKPMNTGSTKKRSTVRARIGMASKFLLGTWAPTRKRSGKVHAEIVHATLAQLACSLNPITMDPIFCALVERAIVECGFATGMRKDPARRPSVTVKKRSPRVFRPSSFSTQYARFTDLNGRRNWTGANST